MIAVHYYYTYNFQLLCYYALLRLSSATFKIYFLQMSLSSVSVFVLIN